MVRLSDEQRAALDRQAGGPVEVVDPVTRVPYVLLSADAYRRVRALIEAEPFDIAESYPLSDEVARRDGWDDRAMDAYDALDPRPKP